jgi:hypothetical protein
MKLSRCGTCIWAKLMPQDLTKRICWGAPPTCIPVSTPGGKPSVQMLRPIVSVTDDQCALYREKNAEDVARDFDALRAQEMMETKQ